MDNTNSTQYQDVEATGQQFPAGAGSRVGDLEEPVPVLGSDMLQAEGGAGVAAPAPEPATQDSQGVLRVGDPVAHAALIERATAILQDPAATEGYRRASAALLQHAGVDPSTIPNAILPAAMPKMPQPAAIPTPPPVVMTEEDMEELQHSPVDMVELSKEAQHASVPSVPTPEEVPAAPATQSVADSVTESILAPDQASVATQNVGNDEVPGQTASPVPTQVGATNSSFGSMIPPDLLSTPEPAPRDGTAYSPMTQGEVGTAAGDEAVARAGAHTMPEPERAPNNQEQSTASASEGGVVHVPIVQEAVANEGDKKSGFFDRLLRRKEQESSGDAAQSPATPAGTEVEVARGAAYVDNKAKEEGVEVPESVPVPPKPETHDVVSALSEEPEEKAEVPKLHVTVHEPVPAPGAIRTPESDEQPSDTVEPEEKPPVSPEGLRSVLRDIRSSEASEQEVAVSVREQEGILPPEGIATYRRMLHLLDDLQKAEGELNAQQKALYAQIAHALEDAESIDHVLLSETVLADAWAELTHKVADIPADDRRDRVAVFVDEVRRLTRNEVTGPTHVAGPEEEWGVWRQLTGKDHERVPASFTEDPVLLRDVENVFLTQLEAYEHAAR